MRKKPDKRTIENMILDSQPTMRTGADQNIRRAVQQTYRELGVSAKKRSMKGITESSEQYGTGKEQRKAGARQGRGLRRFAGFAAAVVAVVGILAVTIAIKGGRPGRNSGGVVPEKNPESDIPVYLLTEVSHPSNEEKKKLIYPEKGREEYELIMDWPGEHIVDRQCDYYDYSVMTEYRNTLMENGYLIIQGDPEDIKEYRKRITMYIGDSVDSATENTFVSGTTIRETYGIFEGRQEWAAYKDGVLIVLEIPASSARVYTYVSRETPDGGCTPAEAWNILQNSETRVDLFLLAAVDPENSCTPNVAFDPIDVTPSGMYEQTQAQVFLTLLMRDGILYRRFFIIRDGIAYEWEAGNVAFGDINGDGETEICMIKNGSRTSEADIRTNWDSTDGSDMSDNDIFYVFEHPKEDGVPQITTMKLDSSDFPKVEIENSGVIWISHYSCYLDCAGTDVIVYGKDKYRKYKLYMTDSLYLSDFVTGARVSQHER